jgi:hypothetical protein
LRFPFLFRFSNFSGKMSGGDAKGGNENPLLKLAADKVIEKRQSSEQTNEREPNRMPHNWQTMAVTWDASMAEGVDPHVSASGDKYARGEAAAHSMKEGLIVMTDVSKQIPHQYSEDTTSANVPQMPSCSVVAVTNGYTLTKALSDLQPVGLAVTEADAEKHVKYNTVDLAQTVMNFGVGTTVNNSGHAILMGTPVAVRAPDVLLGGNEDGGKHQFSPATNILGDHQQAHRPQLVPLQPFDFCDALNDMIYIDEWKTMGMQNNPLGEKFTAAKFALKSPNDVANRVKTQLAESLDSTHSSNLFKDLETKCGLYSHSSPSKDAALPSNFNNLSRTAFHKIVALQAMLAHGAAGSNDLLLGWFARHYRGIGHLAGTGVTVTVMAQHAATVFDDIPHEQRTTRMGVVLQHGFLKMMQFMAEVTQHHLELYHNQIFATAQNDSQNGNPVNLFIG